MQLYTIQSRRNYARAGLGQSRSPDLDLYHGQTTYHPNLQSTKLIPHKSASLRRV